MLRQWSRQHRVSAPVTTSSWSSIIAHKSQIIDQYFFTNTLLNMSNLGVQVGEENKRLPGIKFLCKEKFSFALQTDDRLWKYDGNKIFNDFLYVEMMGGF